MITDTTTGPDGKEYAPVPAPYYGDYQPQQVDNLVSFESRGGYLQQWNPQPSPYDTIPITWKKLTEAQKNTLLLLLNTRRGGVWTLPIFDAVKFDGTATVPVMDVRTVSANIPKTPDSKGLWTISITVRQA